MPCDNKAFLKGVQFVLCLVGLLYKVMTTWEASRVGHLFQKQSREWTWASYTNPLSTASIFIDIAFGAYALISLAHLIGHIGGDPKTTAEVLLMVIGFIFMVAVGGLLVIAVDDVPDELIDNTVVLAVLALLAGILFLTDAGTKCARKPPKAKKKEPVKKRDIQVIPKETAPKEEVSVVDEGPKKAKTEEIVKAETHPEKPTNGISSVEIRIKDPRKNWPVYGDVRDPKKNLPGYGVSRPKDIDVLAQAEAVDRMLTEEQFALGRARGHVPSLKQSPLRHTSSFYINPSPNFAWKRLSEKN